MKARSMMKLEIIEKYRGAERMFTCYTKNLKYQYNEHDAIVGAKYLGIMDTCAVLMIQFFDDYSLRDRILTLDRRIHRSDFEES